MKASLPLQPHVDPVFGRARLKTTALYRPALLAAMAHYMPAPITAHWLATDASKDYKEEL